MELFPSAIDQDIFYLVYAIWIIAFFVERIIISSDGQGKTKTRADRGSALVIYASVFVSIGIAYAFAYAGITGLPDWTFYLGIFAMVGGILIREWAVATLRGYFSYQVRVREDHKVIDKGLYRVIRHPAYAGSMLTLVGLGTALRSWEAVLALVVFFSVAYGYRIRIEERALLAELGDDYASYMKRTKRLIPFIL